jgi:hypothetical protein
MRYVCGLGDCAVALRIAVGGGELGITWNGLATGNERRWCRAWRGANMAKSKVQVGATNRNRQRLIAKTDLPGTDHNQHVWHLHCAECGFEYGANGSDFHLRKCPTCQGGAAGLEWMTDEPPVPEVKLDWTWHEGEALAQQVENYAQAVLTRVLPSLTGLTEEQMDDVMEAYNMNVDTEILRAGGDDLYSMLARDLGAVRHELFGLAFAGLFHLFERMLMGALRRANGRSQGRLIMESERELALRQMQNVLGRGQYSIEASGFAPSFKKLRLIAGAVKHPDGRAVRELVKAFLELIRVAPCDAMSIQSLALSEALFTELASAVASFWRNFPEGAPGA